MEAAGQEPELPECPAPFLISRLIEIGPSIASGFGMVPLSWRDLDAWQQCAGLRLPPWQARMMIDLSREFCGFLTKAEKADCPAPWIVPMTEDRREEIGRKLRVGFKALIMSKEK